VHRAIRPRCLHHRTGLLMTQLAPRPLTTPAPSGLEWSRAADALDRAGNGLLCRQDAAGWWKGELETNVTMDDEDLLPCQFLGIRTDDETARSAGGSARSNGATGPGRRSAAAPRSCRPRSRPTPRSAGLAIPRTPRTCAPRGRRSSPPAASKRAGLHPDVARPVRAVGLGVAARRPPELIFLPPSVPFNVYDFACGARQTVVPLSIVRALRPVRPLGFTLAELRTYTPRPSLPSRGGLLHRLDRLAAGYERVAPGRVRRTALKRAADWIVVRQEADGSWGGIQPPRVYTALAVIALSDAGLPAHRPSLVSAGRWLLDEEITVRGTGPAVAPAGTRWLGVRVRQRPVPGHRRHRRGHARTTPRGRPDRSRGSPLRCCNRWVLAGSAPGRSVQG
jgi:squalene-hopene/tetraprenyl-beta-curcumene cyclase